MVFLLGIKTSLEKHLKRQKNLAQEWSDIKWLAESVADEAYLGDPIWEKQLLEKKKKINDYL